MSVEDRKVRALEGIHNELKYLNKVLAAFNENFVKSVRKPGDTITTQPVGSLGEALRTPYKKEGE